MDSGHAVLRRQLCDGSFGCSSDGNPVDGDYARLPTIGAYLEYLIASLVVDERRVRVVRGDLVPADRIIAAVPARADGGADVLGGDRRACEVAFDRWNDAGMMFVNVAGSDDDVAQFAIADRPNETLPRFRIAAPRIRVHHSRGPARWVGERHDHHLLSDQVPALPAGQTLAEPTLLLFPQHL